MAQPRGAGNIVEIFPPWWPPERSLIAASSAGPVLGSGAFSFMVAVRGKSTDDQARLRAAGAILILDGARFPFCGQRA